MFDDKEYARQYYRKNKAKLDARVAQWKEEHPERSKEYSANYREQNRKKITTKARARRKKYKKEVNAWYKQYRENSPRAFMAKKLGNLRKGVKRTKTVEYEIDLDFVMTVWDKQGGKCAISGYPMTTEFHNPYSASIDRIDSNRGYTKDNIQLLCQTLNFAKNSFPNDVILAFWKGRPSHLGENTPS